MRSQQRLSYVASTLALAVVAFGAALMTPAILPKSSPHSHNLVLDGVVHAGGISCPENAPTACNNDPTLTSALRVKHEQDGSGRDVEPDTGDTWLITATYKVLSGGVGCSCDTTEITATVSVDWDGTDWSASCTGCVASGGNPHIRNVDVCGGAECGSNASEYILILDVDYSDTTNHCNPAYLTAVEYTSDVLDDGDVFTTSPCSEILGVSSIDEPYYAVDTDTWACAFDCNHLDTFSDFPTVTILYE